MAKQGDPISKKELQNMVDSGFSIADIMRKTGSTRNKVEYYFEKYKLQKPPSKFVPLKYRKEDPKIIHSKSSDQTNEYSLHSDDELITALIYHTVPGCKCPTCKIIKEIEFRRAQKPHKNCAGGC